MKITTSSIGLVLALGAIAPAQAQYSSSMMASPAEPAPAAVAKPAEAPAQCQAHISKEARPALIELQTAVIAKDKAAVATKAAAANALAKTPDDKCLVGMLQMKAAADANDFPGLSAAIDAQIASGALGSAQLAPLYDTLGRIQYNNKNYAGASASFERALQLAPGASETMVMLGSTRAKQSRVPESLDLFGKARGIEKAAGRKVPEEWLMREVGVAYEAKDPRAQQLSRDWVAAYPSPKSWSDTLHIYEMSNNVTGAPLLDIMRLARATKALTSEIDYVHYANTAILWGFSGEGLAVLNEGFAAGTIQRTSPAIADVLARATAKSGDDRSALEASAKAALAAATAKPALSAGDVYLGQGDYARAADMYRAAQGKTGVDASLANLRLGMTLTMAGDKAGARTALQAVTGKPAGIAQYWLIYLNQRP